MQHFSMQIRMLHPKEYGILREFLYQAIYIPKGAEPPSRSVIDLPELQVYIASFGTRPDDHCLVAEVKGKIVGAVWSRIMEDYGHVDEHTPSLAVSLLPEYRNQGIGTQLLNRLLDLLLMNGYHQASLSVQKENPAARLYRRLGFQVLKENDTEYLMLKELSRTKFQTDKDKDNTTQKDLSL